MNDHHVPLSNGSRPGGFFSFWLAPFLIGAVILTVTYDFSEQQNRHAFEQGTFGFVLNVVFLAAACAALLPGYGFALLVATTAHRESGRMFCIASAVAGMVSAAGWLIVVPMVRIIAGQPDASFIGFYAAGVITVSFGVTVLTLWSAFAFGFLSHFRT